MSQYLILIYADEAQGASVTPEDMAQLTKEHMEFGQRHAAVIRGGNALQPTNTATSVRPDRPGGYTVTDGAFAETKEALGGYYLIEAADLDQALAVAKECPRGSAASRSGRSGRCVPGRRPCRAGDETRWTCTRPRRPWPPRSPARTAASGPSCSPRRCASRATSTWPRNASRTPTPGPWIPGARRGFRPVPVPG